MNTETLVLLELREWKHRALSAESLLRAMGLAGLTGSPPDDARLFDSQWVNVVNHDNCYRDWTKEDAIAHAVKMTERYMRENFAKGFPKEVRREPQA